MLVASAAAGSLAPLATPSPVHAAPQPVATGTVTWGVKHTFRTYIEGPVAHGSVVATGGATRTPSGTFQFPVTGGTFDGAAPSASVAATGELRFAGHDYGSGALFAGAAKSHLR